MKIYKADNGKCNISGENIRRLRIEKQMSQEQLAAVLQLTGMDINQKAISRIETGLRVVPDYELVIFSDFFKVGIDEIIEQST